MVISAQIVVHGQACVTSGGIDGSGVKEILNGRALGSEGRCSRKQGFHLEF